MLKETFVQLLRNYTSDDELIESCWAEIEQQYSRQGRYYHNLAHLENLLVQLIAIKDKIQDWEIILFTLYYHDVIYNPTESDNEKESALLAERRMKQLSLSNGAIEQCKKQIMATKSHNESTDSDTNYFTDADLSILGEADEMYQVYCSNIRKEYAMFAEDIYITGRQRVLRQFLMKNRIFKTAIFYQRLESRARDNIRQELGKLQALRN